MSDPAFLAAHGGLGKQGQAAEEALTQAMAQLKGSPDEVREDARAKLKAKGFPFPTPEEGVALFDEVVALQQRAASVLAQDRLRGWDGSEKRVADELAKESDTDD